MTMPPTTASPKRGPPRRNEAVEKHHDDRRHGERDAEPEELGEEPTLEARATFAALPTNRVTTCATTARAIIAIRRAPGARDEDQVDELRARRRSATVRVQPAEPGFQPRPHGAHHPRRGPEEHEGATLSRPRSSGSRGG